jgi:hypothetical protein
MSHEAETVRATVKARSWTPALPSKDESEMMPFLMVEATRAPTRTAPRNSHRAAAMHACLSVSDLDETEVANELATCNKGGRRGQRQLC